MATAVVALATWMIVPTVGAAELPNDAPTRLMEALDARLDTGATEQYRPLAVDGRLQAVHIDRTAVDSRSMRLDLFDVAVTAELDRVDRRAPGDLSWIGTPTHDPEGHVVLVAKGDVLVGNVLADGRWYAIRVLPDGTQVVMESDAALSPPGLDADAVAVAGRTAEAVHSDQPDSAGAMTIDVMVAYTPAARDSQGGTAAIEAIVQLAIDEINVAFANSETSPRFRLVQTSEVAYEESGSLSTDLTRLIGKSDGHMDGVHAVRDNAGADLVALLVDRAGSYAGMAQMPNKYFSVEAPFSVTVEHYVAGPYFVLAHELGHNLGGGHDPDNGNGTFPFSNGHRVVGEFRTIMSYSCRQGPCPRVPHYSNPDVTYAGHPTGTVDSDNTRTFDDTLDFVAGYRDSNQEPRDGHNGVIGDWVWEDTNGNGFQDAGEAGVAGVTVRLRLGSVVASTTATAADGTYRFDGLAAGTYRVEFVAPEGRSFTSPSSATEDVDSDAAPASGWSDDVVLEAGETNLTVDAGLSPAEDSAEVGNRVWEDANGNGRQDPGEAGVAGVTVRLKLGTALVATTTTASDGTYRFDGLAPGRYRVQFVAPPGRSLTARHATTDDLDSDAARSNGLSPAVVLTAGETDLSVDAGLSPEEDSGGDGGGEGSGVVGSRVWEDADGNGVQDAGEPGVAGVTVRLRKGARVVATTTTGADGTYRFEAVAPGRYRVEFIAPAGRTFTKRNVGSDLSDSDAVPRNGRSAFVLLGAGETDLSVDAGLLP